MEEIGLPLPTSRIQHGPRLTYRADHLLVEWDYQADDGAIRWAAVAFDDVAVFKFRTNLYCLAEHVDAYHALIKLSDSDLLRMVEGTRTEGVPPVPRAHFRMFFDDGGCIDVIAREASFRPVEATS